MDPPFLRPYDPRLMEVVTDGAVHVLVRHGVDRFSIAKIARWMRVTPSALLNDHSRARLVECIVVTFGRRWLEWSVPTYDPDGVVIRLPETAEELEGVRVWSDLRRLADAEELHGNPAPRVRVGEIEQAERDVLRHWLVARAQPCCPPNDEDVPVLAALVSGLRVELATTAPAIAYAQASDVRSRALAALSGHREGCLGLRAAG